MVYIYREWKADEVKMMIKPVYNYKGVPIAPGARNAYRPGRYSPSSNSLKTVLRILLILVALALIYWGVVSLIGYFHSGSDSETTAVQTEGNESAILPAEPVSEPQTPAVQTAAVQEKPTVQEQPAATKSEAQPAAQPEAQPAAQTAAQPAVQPKKPQTRLTQAQFVAWRKAESYLRAKEYEKARAQLAQIFQWLPADHSMYPYTQKLLAQAADGLKQSGALSKITYMEYTVKRGDTFGRIASKHGIPADVLKQANADIPDWNKLARGQTVRIPKNNWHLTIDGGKTLSVYDGNKLIRIYTLNPRVPVPAANFIIRENNEEWNALGLSKSDIQSLNEIVPVGTLVRVTR